VRIPTLVPECSTDRLLTTDWIDGLSFDQFMVTASPDTKQRAGEVVWRFAQHAVNRHGIFNGDPHPGNFLFLPGAVAFLDFGFVRRLGAPFVESWRRTIRWTLGDGCPPCCSASPAPARWRCSSAAWS
jgi:predicted unusual protein kinase regulating ubiquinone biosynthesis (AarF/ABC1/UbiB family)